MPNNNLTINYNDSLLYFESKNILNYLSLRVHAWTTFEL